MKAFLSYSRQDSEWVRGTGLRDIGAPPLMEWIKEQLALIGVELWIDTRLEEQIGDDFAEDISTRLMQADLAVILVSQDFITSQFIAAKEMTIIRERAVKGEMRVFPILVSTVIWQDNEMAQWISRLQIYPAATRSLHNEISSLREMKTHRTEILRLIKNIVAEPGGQPTAKAAGAFSAPKPTIPVNYQPAGVPRRTQALRLIFGGLAAALLLIGAAFYSRSHFGKNGTDGTEASGVNLPPPVLSAESKNLDFPPAIYGSKVLLEWTAFSVPDTDMFEVAVSKSQDFPEDETIVKQAARENLILERAQEKSNLLGRLYWRVRITRTRQNETSKGPWSDTGAFEVYNNALSRIVLSQRLLVGTSAIQNLPGDTIRIKGAGNYEGLDADIVSQIVARLRIKLRTPSLSSQFVNMAWKDLLPVVSRNQVDIAISGITATRVREREYNVRFSRSYYSTAQVAMALKSSGVSSLADALKRKAYSIEGRSGNRVAQAVFPDNEIVPGAVHYDKLFAVLRDHPDAVAVQDFAMLYAQTVWAGTMDQYAFFPIVSTALPEEKRKDFLDAHNDEDCDHWAIAVEASQSELLNEINGCLDLLEADGRLSQLVVHHNYPESSLQNCQVTVSYVESKTAQGNEVKTQPKRPPPPPTVEKKPTPGLKPEVETAPFSPL